MKALAVVLFILIVLAHPAAAVVVVGSEFGICAVFSWLIWRALRQHPYPYRRSA